MLKNPLAFALASFLLPAVSFAEITDFNTVFIRTAQFPAYSNLADPGQETSAEIIAAQLGQYPDKRSDNKGSEPEGITVGEYGGETLIFVNLERASIIPVYKFAGTNTKLKTVLFSGIGPEGGVALPSRNVFVSANEADDPDANRAHVNIYQYSPSNTPIADVYSLDKNISWGAISGADNDSNGNIYFVSDSFYSATPAIYKANNNGIISEKVLVKNSEGKTPELDLEGIAVASDGSFWLVSEGNEDKGRKNQLLHVDSNGKIIAAIDYPGAGKYGLEGVAIDEANNIIWLAMQFSTDENNPTQSRIYAYDKANGKSLGSILYPLSSNSDDSAKIGISGLDYRDGVLYVLERDNKAGNKATLKSIYSINAIDLTQLADGKQQVSKTLYADLLGYFNNEKILVPEKVESLIVEDKQVFIATDNDGIDDSSGETLFRWIPMSSLK